MGMASTSHNATRALHTMEKNPVTTIPQASTHPSNPTHPQPSTASAAAKTVSGLVATLGGLDVLTLNAGIAKSTGDSADGFDKCLQVWDVASWLWFLLLVSLIFLFSCVVMKLSNRWIFLSLSFVLLLYVLAQANHLSHMLLLSLLLPALEAAANARGQSRVVFHSSGNDLCITVLSYSLSISVSPLTPNLILAPPSPHACHPCPFSLDILHPLPPLTI